MSIWSSMNEETLRDHFLTANFDIAHQNLFLKNKIKSDKRKERREKKKKRRAESKNDIDERYIIKRKKTSKLHGVSKEKVRDNVKYVGKIHSNLIYQDSDKNKTINTIEKRESFNDNYTVDREFNQSQINDKVNGGLVFENISVINFEESHQDVQINRDCYSHDTSPQHEQIDKECYSRDSSSPQFEQMNQNCYKHDCSSQQHDKSPHSSPQQHEKSQQDDFNHASSPLHQEQSHLNGYSLACSSPQHEQIHQNSYSLSSNSPQGEEIHQNGCSLDNSSPKREEIQQNGYNVVSSSPHQDCYSHDSSHQHEQIKEDCDGLNCNTQQHEHINGDCDGLNCNLEQHGKIHGSCYSHDSSSLQLEQTHRDCNNQDISSQQHEEIRTDCYSSDSSLQYHKQTNDDCESPGESPQHERIHSDCYSHGGCDSPQHEQSQRDCDNVSSPQQHEHIHPDCYSHDSSSPQHQQIQGDCDSHDSNSQQIHQVCDSYASSLQQNEQIHPDCCSRDGDTDSVNKMSEFIQSLQHQPPLPPSPSPPPPPPPLPPSSPLPSPIVPVLNDHNPNWSPPHECYSNTSTQFEPSQIQSTSLDVRVSHLERPVVYIIDSDESQPDINHLEMDLKSSEVEPVAPNVEQTNQQFIDSMLKTLYEQSTVRPSPSKSFPSVDKKDPSEPSDSVLSEIVNTNTDTSHERTLKRDHAVFLLQEKLRSHVSQALPPLISISSLEMHKRNMSQPDRCKCSQCFANQAVLLTNYEVLTCVINTRNATDDITNSIKPQSTELLRKVEEFPKDEIFKDKQPEKNLKVPFKKRKIVACNSFKAEKTKLEISYPSTPMLSIAEIL